MRKIGLLPKLETLILECDVGIIEEEHIVPPANRLRNLAGLRLTASFAALKSLKLLNIQHELLDWPEFISWCMLLAHGLEELAVSLANSECDDTLEVACQKYAARSGGRLVRLKTLSTGLQVHIPTVPILGSAFDLSALERISAHDCDCEYYDEGSPDTRAELGLFAVCSPSATPNLRDVTILELQMQHFDILETITTGRDFFAAVNAAPYCGRGKERRGGAYELAKLSRAPKLLLPQPYKMTGVDLATQMANVRNCGWLTHLSIIMFEDSSRFDYEWEAGKPVSRLPLLQLLLRLPVYCEILATLPKLTVLQLRMCYRDLADQDFALAAYILAKACPTLRYIHFGHFKPFERFSRVGQDVWAVTWPNGVADTRETREPRISRIVMTPGASETAHFFFGLSLY